MISRMAKTATVTDVVRQSRKNGYRVEFAGHDADTCQVFDGKVQVYWALRKTDGHDVWIVRYRPDYFETVEPTWNERQLKHERENNV